MLNQRYIGLLIPALNEAASLPSLLKAIPKYVDQIVVVDNGSTDNTADIAKQFGATVICEPVRGYGKACLTGIKALSKADIVVFLDADFCDDPSRIKDLCLPISRGDYDFVLGSRMHKQASMHLTFPQRFGNQFACLLMKLIWDTHYRDLGPFRAISKDALERIYMQDEDFGWTVEMQINAQHYGLKILELELPYRDRLFGESKVSGTLKGVWLAGTKILYVIARSYFRLKQTPSHQTSA